MKAPTSPTAAEGRSPGRAASAGFTLVELLVTLAIAALLLALVPPSLQRLKDTLDYQDTVRAMVSDLRRARQIARTEGREARFSVDLAQRRFGLDARDWRPLPQSLEMRLTVAGIEWSGDAVGAIRFLPQGGATGGHVDLLRPDGSGVRLTVDWLSAAVTQSPVRP